MSTEFLTTDLEKVNYLLNLLIAAATNGSHDPAEYEKLRVELLRDEALSALLPLWLKTHRSTSSFWPFIQSKSPNYAGRRQFLYTEFQEILDALEFGGSKMTSEDKQKYISILSNSSPAPKRKVFIVHGRDNESKQLVARYIENLGIGVIILHEQPSSGMTIIEKIEFYAKEADFALVLYTACDLGRGEKETTVKPRNRARQNVVFEHGYLMAKLGRKNVCALVKGQIETPNDISGVVYVPLDDTGAWKLEVIKELKVCGYSISL